MTNTLENKTILVTRPASQVDDLSLMLESYGATCLHLPAIQIVPLDNYQEVDEALLNNDPYDCLVLTSVNGVQALKARCEALGKDPRQLVGGMAIAVVGPRTAKAVEELNLEVSLVAPQALGEVLIDTLIAKGIQGRQIQGQHILCLRARLANSEVIRRLRRAGAQVTDLAVYDTVFREMDAPEIWLRLRSGQLDYLTFTSGSCVESFVSRLPEGLMSYLNQPKLVAIGPVTASRLQSLLGRVDLVAEPYSLSGMVDAICRHSHKTTQGRIHD